MFNNVLYPHLDLNNKNPGMRFIKVPIFQKGIKKPSFTIKKTAKKPPHSEFPPSAGRLFTKGSYSKEEFSYKPSQRDDRLNHKAQQCLACIDDPLWKEVCAEVLRMMPPLFLLKLWESQLGHLYSQKQVVDLYCPTKDVAQFTKAYDFVILGSLQKYFPALKQIRVKVKSAPQKV